MRKLFCALVILFATSACCLEKINDWYALNDLKVDGEYFEDIGMRRLLVKYYKFEIDNNDVSIYNRVNRKILDTTTVLDLAYRGHLALDTYHINTFSGIEYFSRLEELDASFNFASALDVTGLSELRVLDVSVNELSELDVAQNSKLEVLRCDCPSEMVVYMTHSQYDNLELLTHDGVECAKESMDIVIVD